MTTLREAVEAAYERGWIEATCWAKRDDLCSDVGSPAYIADREPHLDAVMADHAHTVRTPANDREALISGLKAELANFAHNKTLETLLLDSVDMLEADAQDRELQRHNDYAAGFSEATKRAQQVAVPPNLSVGSVSVSHWRGVKSMENIDFQLHRDLPDGTHLLYLAAPQPAYVPLSDAEIGALDCVWLKDLGFDECEVDRASVMRFARAIEQAVRGKA